MDEQLHWWWEYEAFFPISDLRMDSVILRIDNIWTELFLMQ